MGLYGFTIANPSTCKAVRREAIKQLLPYVQKEIEKEGIEFMYYATEKESSHMVDNMVKYLGWEVTETDAQIAVWSAKKNHGFLE